MLNLERDSLILISGDDALRKRFMQACEFLIYKPVVFDSAELYLADEKVKPHTVFYDGGQNISHLKPILDKLESNFRDEVDLFLIADSSPQTLSQTQNLLINFFIDRNQFIESFVAEFLIFQKGLCNFYEISVQDLFPDTVIPFNAFHYLPLNQKYVTLVNENFSLSEVKFKKILSAKILTIHRESVNAYNDYIEYYFDRFSVGLKKRFRAKFYQIFSQWREALVVGVAGIPKTDIYPGSIDDMGEQLKLMCEYLKDAPDPWQLLFDTSQSPMMQYDRSALELLVSAALGQYFGDLEFEKLIELKWALATCRILTPALLYKKRLFSKSQMSPENEELFKKFSEQLTNPISGESKNIFETYSNGYVTGLNPADNSNLSTFVYMGEKLVEAIIATDTRSYSKSDILQGAMAKAKNEGRLNAAWMEEFRLFFTQGNLAQPKFKKENP